MRRVLLCFVVLYTAAAAFAAAGPDEIMTPVITVGGSEHKPRVYHIKQFATDAEMDHIMNSSFHYMLPQEQDTETGMVYELPIGQDPILKGYYKRLYDLFPGGIGTPPSKAKDQTIRIRRYMPQALGANHTGLVGGDYHPPHVDWFETTPGDLSHVLLMTQMLYLTSPEEGGETDFPFAFGGKGYKQLPIRGDLVIWWSCVPAGTRDPLSEHASLPLKRGIKWNAAYFVYDNVKKCNVEPVKEINVPAATAQNIPMKNSSECLFGTTYPSTVSVSAKGTRSSKSVGYSRGYDYDYSAHAGVPTPDGEEAYDAAAAAQGKFNDATESLLEGFDATWLAENPDIKAKILKGDYSWADDLKAELDGDAMVGESVSHEKQDL